MISVMISNDAMSRKQRILIDATLYDWTPQEAIRQGKRIGDKAATIGPKGVVAESWGVLALPVRQIRKLLVEDELLDG